MPTDIKDYIAWVEAMQHQENWIIQFPNVTIHVTIPKK